MFADRHYRVISYHDTWISVDPIRGCPYQCVYCILRYNGNTGRRSEQMVSPDECVKSLLEYPLFVRGHTPLAVGNETDMLHSSNVDYLVDLLAEMRAARIDNPIVLITKAPLFERSLQRIRAVSDQHLIFFLSYSGLGPRYEPNFTDNQLRGNFRVAKANGFPVVHYWRPLLPENTTVTSIREMLSFVSSVADATVFIGLKLHPQLTRVITQDGVLVVPDQLQDQKGEWIEAETIKRIYYEASRICPEYPLYRHTSCALASVLHRPNHTATVYRKDICPPSQCPLAQRQICEAARCVPSETKIAQVLALLGRNISFVLHHNRVFIEGEVNQEEFAFLLHNLNYPLEVNAVKMQNLYHGNIYEGQKKI
jgi:DNA repair photolyase